LVAALATLAVAAAPGSANTSQSVAGALNFPWPDLLPPLTGDREPQPGPVPGCAKPAIGCVDHEIAQMTAEQDRRGCDHRAVFATTYLTLTQTLRQTLREDPAFFDDPEYLYYEDALFADYWLRAVAAYDAGRPVPPAWRIAFETAGSGDANAGQDMLLGINAHVQRDMPFMLAELGLRRPDGESRKLDHDRVNEILERGYEPVVRAIARRYDPLLYTTNASWSPVDDVGGLELVKSWREGAWRNAERLLNASTDAERQQVAQSIEDNAASWAEMMAGPQQPGYRAQRDAYCAAHVHPRPATSPAGRAAPPRCAPRRARRPAARHRRRATARRRHAATRRRVARRRTVHRRATRRRAGHRNRCRRPVRRG
jgi:hypothetical protein